MWIKLFVDYLRYERNLSECTTLGYSVSLEAFRRFYKSLDETLEWDVLDGDVVRDWMMHMVDQGNSASTVCCRLSALRTFYKFLLRNSWVEHDPTRLITAPKKQKLLPVYVRDEQMNALLDGKFFPDSYEGVRDHLILLTFYCTGIRLSELVGLNTEDVDVSQGQLRVTGKRNKQRIIPFGSEMSFVVTDYSRLRDHFLCQKERATNAFFLDERKAERILPEKVRAIVKSYLGMVTTQKKKSPHVLRHTFATSMLNHKADLLSVKELLGHESLSTTEIYTHASFEEMKNMYNLAHPRAPKKEEVRMDIKIQAIHFDASEKLHDFIVKKVSKLEKFYDEIRKVEVSLKVVKPETAMNKEVQIILALPGKELIAQEIGDTFEEGIDKSLESLTRQLSKFKEMQKNR